MMLSYDIITTTWLLIMGTEFPEQDTIHVYDRELTTAFYPAYLGIPFGIKNGGATNGSEMSKVYDLLWNWICSVISRRFW